MVEEARLEQRDEGLVAVTPGWFVVNVRNAAWVTNDEFGSACVFEGTEAPFDDLGYTLAVVPPGKPSALYHREGNQEDFLILAGECLLLVEGQERELRTWDFVHCPPGTEHIFVATGDGPCVIFMAGGRTREKNVVYPVSEVALRHGAGVERETGTAKEAYAPFPPWRPGAPSPWEGLPG